MMSAGMLLIPMLGGFFAGVSALLFILWLTARHDHLSGIRMTPPASGEPRTFRFRNGYLVEHSDAVGFLLPEPLDRMTAWADLTGALKTLVPGAAGAMKALSTDGTAFQIDGTLGDDTIRLIGHCDGDDLCICMAIGADDTAAIKIDRASLAALGRERDTLLRSNEMSPALGWTVDAGGQVTWSNAAYRTLVSRCLGPDAARGWPLPKLFPDGDTPAIGLSRRKCQDADGQDLWYDVTLSQPDLEGICHGHALPLDMVIKAETSLRLFIQTLTKSFAFLPTGLAIFDAEKRLTLFNPALMDMTGLDAGWLSGRPHLTEVFDRLRDGPRSPEPRDYKTWLHTVSGSSGQAGGIHVENWTVPTGTSQRLTATPQDDGTITLLLEDISAIVAAEQRIQADQTLFGGLLDMTEAGIITFDAAGRRTTANATARAIWHGGNTALPLPKTLTACLTLWAKLSHPSPLLGEIRDLARGPMEERGSWDETLTLTDGSTVTIRVLPQQDGGLALALRADHAFPVPLPILVGPDRMTA